MRNLLYVYAFWLLISRLQTKWNPLVRFTTPFRGAHWPRGWRTTRPPAASTTAPSTVSMATCLAQWRHKTAPPRLDWTIWRWTIWTLQQQQPWRHNRRPISWVLQVSPLVMKAAQAAHLLLWRHTLITLLLRPYTVHTGTIHTWTCLKYREFRIFELHMESRCRLA